MCAVAVRKSSSLTSFTIHQSAVFALCLQHRKSVIHGLPIKSSKSDWLTMRREYSVHAQKIGSDQSSRSQPPARRIVGSKQCICWQYHMTISRAQVYNSSRSRVFFMLTADQRLVFDWIAGSSGLTCWKQGRIVRKPANASPGLKFIRIQWNLHLTNLYLTKSSI